MDAITFPRYIQRSLDIAMKDTPVVCLLGPRQCGKSTLARLQDPEREYLTLDDVNLLRAAANDPEGFLSRLPRYVTIDEVQRVPELLLSIKRSVDHDRQPGRFLLTGSANLLHLPRLADSLAGRMECVYLHPLAEAEITRSGGKFLGEWLGGRLFEEKRLVLREDGYHLPDLTRRVVMGGFPEPVSRGLVRAKQWYQQYLSAMVERDVRDVANIRDGAEIGRLLEISALRTGGLLNASSLATDLRLDRQTVERYLTVLERLFLIRRLQPYHRSTANRLVKTPKIHLTDGGLACALSGLEPGDWNAKRDAFGHVLETFVLQQLIAQAGWTDPALKFWHYRDKDQVEVDVVITSGRKVWGVEVKASSTLRNSDGKGLRRLKAIAGEDFQDGIVFYDGRNVLPVGEDFNAVPLEKLWRM